jgi:UDP-glucose 4-epimerase
MKNILVTGGNGFIGSHLVDRLALLPEIRVTVFDLYPRYYDDLPANVDYVQGNLCDFQLIRRTIQERDISLIYHIAWASIPETSLSNVSADFEANIVPSINLLEVCRDTGINEFVFISSGGTVYGLPKMIPIEEDHPTNPICAYGVTKLMAEKYIQMFSQLYGLKKYVIFRPSVPYGPRQNPHRRQGAVSVFIYNALRKTPVTIWGNADNIIRDYFYIDDMTDALVKVIDRQFSSTHIFNLGGNVAYTLNDIVLKIQSTLGIKLKVQQEKSRKFDIQNLHLDSSLSYNYLNWKPKISLEEGIIRTAKWMDKNENK